jgi:hypothetical protein
MKASKKRERRDPAVVAAFFDWQKRFRDTLLRHPEAKKKPRLFALGYILSDSFDWEDCSCFPSRELLADALGVSTTQVSTLTRELTDMGFLTVRRRRNTSAVYVGNIPQEVNCTLLPKTDESIVATALEVKSSRVRKSTGVYFGKSTTLHPNVLRNVASNEGDMALQANVPASDGKTGLKSNARDDSAPSSAPLGAPGASRDAHFPEPKSEADADEFMGRIEAAYNLSPALTRRIRELLSTGTLTQKKLDGMLRSGERRDVRTA